MYHDLFYLTFSYPLILFALSFLCMLLILLWFCMEFFFFTNVSLLQLTIYSATIGAKTSAMTYFPLLVRRTDVTFSFVNHDNQAQGSSTVRPVF